MTIRLQKVLLRTVAAVVLAGLLAVAGVYAYFPLKGLFIRSFRMPSVVAQPFVVELQESSSVQQRQQFFDAWRTGRSYGLHRRLFTIEGDPIQLWAITDRGNLVLVTDYTRDAFSHRGIAVQHPSAASLYRGRDGNPLRAWFPGEDEVYLRLEFPDGSDAFF